MFASADLDCFIDQATYVVVNDYESKLLQEKTGKNLEQIAVRVVPDGPWEAKGADIHSNGTLIYVCAAQIGEAKNPTGYGDAFRAGLLYGLANRRKELTGNEKIENKNEHNRRHIADQFNVTSADNSQTQVLTGPATTHNNTDHGGKLVLPR